MTEQTQAEKDIEENLTIETAIESFCHRLHALHTLAETQLKHARENQAKEAEKVRGEIHAALQVISSDTANPSEAGHAVNLYWDSKKDLEMLEGFPQEDMLAETMFIAIFSNFDAYLGELLRILFSIKPERLDIDSSRTVGLHVVLNSTRQEIIDQEIDNEIDTL